MISRIKIWTHSKRIVRDIVKNAKPGGIIALHVARDTKPNYERSNMLRALPQIIDALKEKGFNFVTIPELLKDTDA